MAARNIERLIHQAEEEQDQDQRQEEANPPETGDRRRTFVLDEDFPRRPRVNYNKHHPVVFDSIGSKIVIGDTIAFMTRGRYNSREGIVYKISETGSCVTARDNRGRSISRAPQNIIVVAPREEE